MPRYDRYIKLEREQFNSVDRGISSVLWADDGKQFQYMTGGVEHVFDVATMTSKEGTLSNPPAETGRRGGRRGGRGPQRGRQFDTATSPDGKLKAVTRDRNVYISDANGKNEVAVTTDGSVEKRIKYGIASWVYGEELGVHEAMWFSPDGKKLAFYRFDESKVKDYYIAYDQLKLQDALDTEPYPKVGQPNPVVALEIYDIAKRTTTPVDTSFADPILAEYVYNVRWAADGSELYYYRMPRKQDVMEWCAADRDTGKSRVIIREQRTDGWVNQAPELRFLKDNKRFLWRSDRSGFDNYYLYDTTGKLLSTVTELKSAEVDGIASVDEQAKTLYYSARDGDNAYLRQFHRVQLDGKGDKRLTDPKLSHTVFIAPGGKNFVDISESTSEPPTTTLCDGNGKKLKELSKADLTKWNELGLKKNERFTFIAADGKTQCYGTLSFPSDFDPSKKYPLLVFVYGGPESGGDFERFAPATPITELGFVVATMDGRNTKGRGRAFLVAGYRKLGITEIDDHAAGVKSLMASRSYLDARRVGIQGTSYGGYFSALSILRYPDVYAVACASSPVTDFRLYDSIYTERYMGQPGEDDNKAGYDAGSCMTYAQNLKGRLMLYYGTADNNVHPSNAIQLANKLEQVGKKYDMMVGADRQHSQMNSSRMWEYFVNYLILDAPKDALSVVWPQVRARRKRTG